jgi:hypothetical protein
MVTRGVRDDRLRQKMLDEFCVQPLSCVAGQAPFRWVALVEICRVESHLREAPEAGEVLPVVELGQQDAHFEGSLLVPTVRHISQSASQTTDLTALSTLLRSK